MTVDVVLALLLATSVAGTVAFVLPARTLAHLTVAVLGRALSFASLAALTLGLVTHRWWAVAPAVVVDLVDTALRRRRGTRGDRSLQDGTPLVVMTANLYDRRVDPAIVVDVARRHAVDVLLLQELDPAIDATLASSELSTDLPHRASFAEPDGRGVAIWSRHPLSDARRVPGFRLGVATARVALPDGTTAGLVCVHLDGPVWSSREWSREIARLPALLDRQPDRTVLVGGDFNAGRDVAQYRRLRRTGHRDITDVLGIPPLRTWRSTRGLPALLALDHVLVRHAGVSTAWTERIAGSDHRAVIAVVHVPTA